MTAARGGQGPSAPSGGSEPSDAAAKNKAEAQVRVGV
jgi:hypothetical protein